VRTVASPDEAQALVRNEKSASGKGGMDSKVNAARIVTATGEHMIVADGRTPDVLIRLLAGEELGTVFLPAAARTAGRTTTRGRNRWISSARPTGSVVIDEGATKALLRGDRSLLPAGITTVKGTFEPGEIIEILSPEGTAIARGLTNYHSTQVAQIQGKKSQEVRKMFAEAAYDEVVHRDNLVLLMPRGSGGAAGTAKS
jgi:glutamate 5-kinase